MPKPMPRIHLENLTGFDYQVAEAITNNGRLRATKPKVTYETYHDEAYDLDRRRPTAPSGHYAYVWRMIAFYASPRRVHQCMPVTAYCDLPGRDYEATRAIEKEMDGVINRILDQIDPEDWHGVIRWGQAYGKIGTPRYNKEGAVIYR